MDERLLAEKGIVPEDAETVSLEHYALHVGERATLVMEADSRVYGVLMTISAGEADRLYSEDSVSDYVAERVMVRLANGSNVSAVCYNLPEKSEAAADSTYVRSLLELAVRLGFPDDYVAQIELFS